MTKNLLAICLVFVVASSVIYEAQGTFLLKLYLRRRVIPRRCMDFTPYACKGMLMFANTIQGGCPPTRDFQTFFSSFKSYMEFISSASASSKNIAVELNGRANSLFKACSALDASGGKSSGMAESFKSTMLSMGKTMVEQKRRGSATMSLQQRKELVMAMVKWTRMIATFVKTASEKKGKSVDISSYGLDVDVNSSVGSESESGGSTQSGGSTKTQNQNSGYSSGQSGSATSTKSGSATSTKSGGGTYKDTSSGSSDSQSGGSTKTESQDGGYSSGQTDSGTSAKSGSATSTNSGGKSGSTYKETPTAPAPVPDEPTIQGSGGGSYGKATKTKSGGSSYKANSGETSDSSTGSSTGTSSDSSSANDETSTKGNSASSGTSSSSSTASVKQVETETSKNVMSFISELEQKYSGKAELKIFFDSLKTSMSASSKISSTNAQSFLSGMSSAVGKLSQAMGTVSSKISKTEEKKSTMESCQQEVMNTMKQLQDVNSKIVSQSQGKTVSATQQSELKQTITKFEKVTTQFVETAASSSSSSSSSSASSSSQQSSSGEN